MSLLSCLFPGSSKASRPRPDSFDGGSSQAARPSSSSLGSTSKLPARTPATEVPAASGQNASANGVAPLEPSSVTECSPFELLDGLKLGKVLGRGTFGFVLKGLWQGAPVAVKVMVTDTLDRAVLRELLVGPHMHHPNVVHTYFTRCARLSPRYFDFIEANPRPEHTSLHTFDSEDGFGNPKQEADSMPDPVGRFHEVLYELRAYADQIATLVVMEFCDKNTLGSALHRGLFHAGRHWNEVLAKRALLRTAQEVARAMIHLHTAGIVHGDLKPANVLLSESRGDRRGFRAKLADFGLAHCLMVGTRYKSTANSYGTVAYMAPEGFRGRVGLASDVYSFGVMLWELLHRELPYNGINYDDVVRRMLDGSLALEWCSCRVVPDLVDLGKRCVDPDPEQRPTFVQVEATLVRIEARLREQAEMLRRQQRQQPPASAAADASAAPKTPPCTQPLPLPAAVPAAAAAVASSRPANLDGPWRAMAVRAAAGVLPIAATYTSDPSNAQQPLEAADQGSPAALGADASGSSKEDRLHGESYVLRDGLVTGAGQGQGLVEEEGEGYL